MKSVVSLVLTISQSTLAVADETSQTYPRSAKKVLPKDQRDSSAKPSAYERLPHELQNIIMGFTTDGVSSSE